MQDLILATVFIGFVDHDYTFSDCAMAERASQAFLKIFENMPRNTKEQIIYHSELQEDASDSFVLRAALFDSKNASHITQALENTTGLVFRVFYNVV